MIPMTFTGAILATATLVTVLTLKTAVGHGQLTILSRGKVIPLIADASMTPFPIQLITSMGRHARIKMMACATLWTAPMSHTAAFLITKKTLASGLAKQLSVDVTFGAEETPTPELPRQAVRYSEKLNPFK